MEKSIAAAPQETGGRLVFIDIIRIFALFQVFFQHAGRSGAYVFLESNGFAYVLGLFFYCLGPMCIPLFFMITGAMLVNRDESIKRLFKHRVLRYAVVIIVVQAVEYVFRFRNNLSAVYVANYLEVLYSSYFSDHMWYLYAYFAYLLMLPFIRKLARGMEEKEYIYLFMLWFVLRLCSVGEYYIWGGRVSLNPEISAAAFAVLDVVFYPLLGNYIHNVRRTSKLSTRHMVYLNLAGVAAYAASMLLINSTCKSGGFTHGSTQRFFYTFAAIPATVIYVDLKCLFEKRTVKPAVERILSAAGACTFGAYLFENIYRWGISPVRAYFSFLPPLAENILTALAVEFFAIVITWFIRLIPGVKKFI